MKLNTLSDSEQGRSEEAMVEEKDRTEKREESPDPGLSPFLQFCISITIRFQI